MRESRDNSIARPLWQSATFRQMFLFVIVGGIQYVLDVGVFSCMVLWTGYPILSNLLAKVVASPWGYYLNGAFTFGVLGRRRGNFAARYLTAWVVSTLLSTTIIKSLTLLSQIIHDPVLIVLAKGSVEIGLVLVNFLICRNWVFAAISSDPAQSETSAPQKVLSPGTRSSPSPHGGVLLLLAHFDDEFFFSPVIEEAVGAGRPVYCVYTTDSRGYGVPSEIRKRESLRALESLGVPESSVMCVGVQSGIADGMAFRCLPQMHRAVGEAVSGLDITEIYVLAWEGGHPDHDATHLAAVALARELGVRRLLECPAYSAYQARILPFRVMHWIPRAEKIVTRRFGLAVALRCFASCLHYRSQWRTFLGLAPGAFLGFVVFHRHRCRVVRGIDYTMRPHPGPLFYEKRFGVSFEEFSDATAGFITHFLEPQTSPALASSADKGGSI
jgi:N-acetylglucosamine malate deacetylase 1